MTADSRPTNEQSAYANFKAVRRECDECWSIAECDDCLGALRVYLQQRMSESTGMRKLEDANRRAEMLHEWRNEADDC